MITKKDVTEQNTTDKLEKILEGIHPEDIDQYFQKNGEHLYVDDSSFAEYMRSMFKLKDCRQQDVFLKADIPERYGYKIISGQKRTKQRDTILRICYAAGFTLEETQQALKIYRMPVLYAKIPRDALLMICFNEHKGGIIEVNEFLHKNGMDTLRSSGVQD